MHFATVPTRSLSRWLTNTLKIIGETWELRLENDKQKISRHKQKQRHTKNKAKQK